MTPHRTQHGVNWILIIFGITILTLYMLTECALIVSGTLTLRLYGLYSVIEGLQLQRNLTFSYANMVVVTLIWLAVFNLICLRLLPIDSGLVQTFKFSCT